jgi:hypothetical protein
MRAELDRMIRRAEKIVRVELPRVDAVYRQRARSKLAVIWKSIR